MSVGSVLITGGNRGLGLEFVKQFASLSKAPRNIIVTCRNPETAQDLQAFATSNSNVTILKFDVKDYASYPSIVQQVSDKVGDNGLNLLINNAGIALRGSLGEITHQRMIENFEVNTVCPLLFTQALLPLLKKAATKVGENTLSCSRAAVVNITSKIGSIEDNTSGGFYPYRTSKTALNMVTRSLAQDLKPCGILAFAIHPGWVLTDMGGPNALINTETSVRGMINTLMQATDETAGSFLNYDGKTIPW